MRIGDSSASEVSFRTSDLSAKVGATYEHVEERVLPPGLGFPRTFHEIPRTSLNFQAFSLDFSLWILGGK